MTRIRAWLLLAISFAALLAAVFVAVTRERAPSWDPGDPDPWLWYSPPEGWERHDAGPAVIEAPTTKTFVPIDRAEGSRTRLVVHDATDFQSRMDRIGALYWRVCERRQRNFRIESRQAGSARPGVICRRLEPSISGFAEVDALYEEGPRGSGIGKRILHFVRSHDGRRYRIDYQADGEEFESHRDAVLASLSTLRFAERAPAPGPDRRARLASLQDQLDDEKLWLYDGTVAGALLTDEDLELLRDPAFAAVESLNLFSGHAAGMTGLEVGDAGLEYLAGLPLTFLCLRGTLVTDAGLSSLRGLPLETLVLESTLVEGDGLRHLAGMPLEHLDLARTGVDDASLAALHGLPLQSLDLSSTSVTDAGLAQVVKLGLRTIDLRGTETTEAGLATLGEAGLLVATIPRHIPKDAVARLRARYPEMDLIQ